MSWEFLGKHCTIKTGKLDANASNENGQYPFFTCAINPLKIDKYAFDCDAILVAGNGDLNVKHYNGKFNAYQRTYVLSDFSEDLYPRYCYYFLDNYLDTLRESSIGGVIKYIKLGMLIEAKVPLPSLEEQKCIAAILDKAHSIRQKRQQNLENADALIKSIFLDMFGDPVTNQWATVPIEQLAIVKVGVVIKPAQYYTSEKEGIRAFRSLNVGEMYVKNNNWVYFSEEGNIVNKKSILQENDILVVRSGYPGTSCVVTKDYAGSNAIDLIIATPNTSMANPYFLSAYINSPYGKKQILQGQGGAAQQHFNVGALRSLLVQMPPLELQNKFAKMLFSIEEQKAKQKEHLHEADKVFKALQQQYFTNI